MVAKARIDIIGRDKTKAAFRSAEGSLKRFRATALSIGTVLGVGVFKAATTGAINFADSIDKAAKAAGVGTGFLQEMRFAGDQLGVSNRLVDEGFRRFSRRLGEFANSGAGPAAKAIEKLGIEVNDLQGNFRGSEAIFRDFAVQLQRFDSFAEKSAIAAQIFGDDAGPKLALLLEQGISGIDRLSNEAKAVGAVLSEDVIKNAVEAKDASVKLASVLKAQLTVAFVNLSGPITTAANALVSFSKLVQDALGKTQYDGLSFLNEQIDTTVAKMAKLNQSLAGGELSELKTDKAIIQLKALGQQYARLKEQRDKFSSDTIEVNVELNAEGARLDTESLVNSDKLKKDVEGILARLNPLQAAAIKFNDEVKKIELSDLGSDEKIAAMQQLEQEFAAATGSAKTFADSTKEFEALQDRLFPLQAAVKDFNRELALIKRNTIAGPEQEAAIRRLEEGFSKATGASRKLQKENKALSDGAVDMGFAFSSAFEDAVIDGEKFGDVLDGLLKDIQRVALRTAITQPLGQAVGAGISQTFPAFASGTNFAPGGLAVVGERGPELVDLPRGSRVLPNGAGGTTVNVINN